MHKIATPTGINTDPSQDSPDLLAPLFIQFECPDAVHAPDQLDMTDAFYELERARKDAILHDLVSGKAPEGVGFIAVAQHTLGTAAESVDGKATPLEEALSLIRTSGTGRQERLVMLGDPRVSACFWRKMEMAGKIRFENGQPVLNVNMPNAIKAYKSAAAEIGVDVAGFAQFECARSGWREILPGIKNHEIMVFGSGNPNELRRIGEDVQHFADRLVASGIVADSGISHRPGQEVIKFQSNFGLQRLLTLADNSVILQREAEQRARDASRTKAGSAGPRSNKTPASSTTVVASNPTADHAAIKALFQLLDQPLAATKIRGGGKWNLDKLAQVLELSRELDPNKLRQGNMPRAVSETIVGGLDGIIESCRRTVQEGTASKQGLPPDSQIVKDFASVRGFGTTAGSERTPEFKWLADERSVVRTLVGKPLREDELSATHNTCSEVHIPLGQESARTEHSRNTAAVVRKPRQQEGREVER